MPLPLCAREQFLLLKFVIDLYPVYLCSFSCKHFIQNQLISEKWVRKFIEDQVICSHQQDSNVLLTGEITVFVGDAMAVTALPFLQGQSQSPQEVLSSEWPSNGQEPDARRLSLPGRNLQTLSDHSDVGFYSHGGTPRARWLKKWKIPIKNG